MELIKKIGAKKNKNGKNSSSYGLFICNLCGKRVEKRLADGKKAKSCNCQWHKKGVKANNYKHGDYEKRLYRTWINMKDRCLNHNFRDYKYYGKRGITICDEWMEYISFKNWALANGYQDNLQIDRIDNDGNYEPENCQFITIRENSRKRRTLKLNVSLSKEIQFKYKNGNYTQKEIAMAYGVSRSAIGRLVNNKSWRI